MKTEAEFKVLELLKGGRALSPQQRAEILAGLSAEERRVVQRIATAELGAPSLQIRGKAISALGAMARANPSLQATIERILEDPVPAFQIKAIQALSKLDRVNALPRLHELVRQPGTHPGIALAAARVTAARSGPEALTDLEDLRRRFLALVPNERSPSIVVLDQLIEQARGGATERTGEQPRPIV